mgnify:FL=1
MLLYTRALAVNPTSFAVLNNMGWLEESSGDEARLSVAQGHYAAALALVRPRKTLTLQQPQVRARRDEGRRGDRHTLTFFLAAHTLHSAPSRSRTTHSQEPSHEQVRGNLERITRRLAEEGESLPSS